jgi:hypothetical protein
MAPLPPHAISIRRFPGINPKDVHVVAAAHAVGADVILTLDQSLAAEIETGVSTIAVRSPGTFIRSDLTAHPSFHMLRDD